MDKRRSLREYKGQYYCEIGVHLKSFGRKMIHMKNSLSSLVKTGMQDNEHDAWFLQMILLQIVKSNDLRRSITAIGKEEKNMMGNISKVLLPFKKEIRKRVNTDEDSKKNTVIDEAHKCVETKDLYTYIEYKKVVKFCQIRAKTSGKK